MNSDKDNLIIKKVEAPTIDVLEDVAKEERNEENKIITPQKSKLNKTLKNAWDLVKFAIIAFVIVMPIRMFIAHL